MCILSRPITNYTYKKLSENNYKCACVLCAGRLNLNIDSRYFNSSHHAHVTSKSEAHYGLFTKSEIATKPNQQPDSSSYNQNGFY